MSAAAFGAGDPLRLAGRFVQPTAYLQSRAPKAPGQTDIGPLTALTCSATVKEPNRDDDRDSQTWHRQALSLIWVRFFPFSEAIESRFSA